MFYGQASSLLHRVCDLMLALRIQVSEMRNKTAGEIAIDRAAAKALRVRPARARLRSGGIKLGGERDSKGEEPEPRVLNFLDLPSFSLLQYNVFVLRRLAQPIKCGHSRAIER